MAEYVADELVGHARGNEHRRRAMPKIMKADGRKRRGKRDPHGLDGHAVPTRDVFDGPPVRRPPAKRGVLLDADVEPLRDVVGAERAAVLVGEDAPGVGVLLTPRHLLLGLALPPRAQHALGLLVEHDLAVAAPGLRLAEFVIGLRLADMHPPRIETEVRALQADQLAAARPPVGVNVEQRIQALVDGLAVVQERAALRGRPNHHLGRDVAGLLPALDALGRPQQRAGAPLPAAAALATEHVRRRVVVADLADLHGVVQRARDDGVDPLDARLGQRAGVQAPAVPMRAGGEQAPQ